MIGMDRRNFLGTLSVSCTCALAANATYAQDADETEFFDFCTEIPIPVDERNKWVEAAWGRAPVNDEEATALTRARWPSDKATLTVSFLGGAPSRNMPQRVYESAKKWESHMGLEFQFVEYDERSPSEVIVSFQANSGHWSYVGTDSLSASTKGQPSMNFGWAYAPWSSREVDRVVIHEFGHAISLVHEHLSPESDIPWNEQAVFAYYRRTQGWDDEKIRSAVLDKYNENQVNRTRYDPESCMHYATPAKLLTDPRFATSWNTRLSDGDKAMASFLFPLT